MGELRVVREVEYHTLENVEIFYAKLSKPSNKFNKDNPSWEVQARTSDLDTAKKWKALGIGVKKAKDDDGNTYYLYNFKKKSKTKDGEDAAPPRIVDEDVKPFGNVNIIGNGSVANLKIVLFPTAFNGKNITGVRFLAIQVIRLEVYENANDFQPVKGNASTIAAKANLESFSESSTPNDSFDDDDSFDDNSFDDDGETVFNTDEIPF